MNITAGDRHLSLSWHPPDKTARNGLLTGYNVTFRPLQHRNRRSLPDQEESNYVEVLVTQDRQDELVNATVGGLYPGTAYGLTVTSCTAAGCSVESELYEAKTLDPEHNQGEQVYLRSDSMHDCS